MKVFPVIVYTTCICFAPRYGPIHSRPRVFVVIQKVIIQNLFSKKQKRHLWGCWNERLFSEVFPSSEGLVRMRIGVISCKILEKNWGKSVKKTKNITWRSPHTLKPHAHLVQPEAEENFGPLLETFSFLSLYAFQVTFSLVQTNRFLSVLLK